MDTSPFQGRLLPRERILWSGAPASGLLFTSRDVFLVPFSLLWCGFAIFWAMTSASRNAPVFFDIWGAMFVCIGLFFVAGRFVLDAWLRRRTSYALTDRRILILRGAPFATFTSIDLDRLPQTEIVGAGSGRGTLRFGPRPAMFGGRGMSGWTPALDPVPQFLAIEDAPKVFDLVTRAASDRDARAGALAR